MAAYNLMPPQWQDPQGRWAKVWAEHLAGNTPWLEAFTAHPDDDDFWRSRRVDVTRIECPTFNICGWRDLYADCTPLDHALIRAPKKLMMGPWKHEFPDTAKEAPAAGLWEMQLWIDRWLKGVDSGGLHGSVQAPAVSLYVQGNRGHWRTEAAWPPAGTALQTWYPGDTGALSPQVPASAQTDYAYDPTVGMHSLAWDPWTTALDPNLPRDHSADDARSLCFTTAPLTEPLQIMGAPTARLTLMASALPLNVVLKLSAVAANGASTLITTGWMKLDRVAVAGEQTTVPVPLRTTAYRLEAGERLRLSVACADFPRVWPTPVPASLRLFHGAQTALSLPVQAVDVASGDAAPKWGPLQAVALASANDLGGAQSWNTSRELMTDTVRLEATRHERIRIDGASELVIDHAYGAAVSAARPDLAAMQSTTTVRFVQAAGCTELVARTVSTAEHTRLQVTVTRDGQPWWSGNW
jgi:hypothetical protein